MKFKELRGLFFSFILFILNIALFMYSLIIHDKMKMVISVLIVPLVFITTFTQFYVRVLDDVMLVYRFIGPIAIPTMILYEDIQSIELINKYKIQVYANSNKYNIYIFKADNRVSIIQNKVEGFKNEKN